MVLSSRYDTEYKAKAGCFSTPEVPQAIARLPPILWGGSVPALSSVRSGRESVCAGADVLFGALFRRDEANHQSFVE